MIFDENTAQYINEIMNDIYVINVNKSQLSTLLSISFYAKGIFLAGDCAHTPNFGNLCTSLGLHDIHELAHTLLLA
jgi:2-polyprenyl-6-methoxyphenol hydroxylase-like FAD-dependent oxidoreductase